MDSELRMMWKVEELSWDLRMCFCMCINYKKTFTERKRIIPNIHWPV